MNFIDYFQEWEHTFLVEEYIKGVSKYYPFLKNQDPKEYTDTLIPILEKLKMALKQIHSCNIGMGDLQPANILITETNIVILLILNLLVN